MKTLFVCLNKNNFSGQIYKFFLKKSNKIFAQKMSKKTPDRAKNLILVVALFLMDPPLSDDVD